MPKLDIPRLVVAILEDKVKALVGSEAIHELKKPLLETELQNSLVAATKRAEKRWSAEYEDREVSDLVNGMPLADLPSIQKAIRSFYDVPAAQVAAGAFRNQLSAIVPKDLDRERIEAGVASYMQVLQEELIAVGELREKLNALAAIETARNTARTAAELGQLKELVTALVARDGAANPIKLTRSRAAVRQLLEDCIERGAFLGDEVRKSPPSSDVELDAHSRLWHSWRVYCEQAMRESFSTGQPLQWLKELRPQHLDFRKPWEERAKHLPTDIHQELRYLENLLGRLENYEEPPRNPKRRPPRA